MTIVLRNAFGQVVVTLHGYGRSLLREGGAVHEPDATMVRIGEGIALSQRGEREAARQLFDLVWNDIGGEAGDPLHRCALAHSMADVQEDVKEELVWDLRALAAADLLTDARAAQAGVTSPVAAFYPSLHLNLAECYRKIGDLDQARQHLSRGRALVSTLPDDGYGRTIKGALERLAERLPSV
jgi:tetratricopeptide (TPR) repeat protein